METDGQRLSQYLLKKLSTIPPSSRLLVGICGIPASGKSTFADILSKCIDEGLAAQSSDTRTALVGLDGWHLTRAQLDAFPDPQLAHDRRGIHWTFDGPAYLAFVRRLRAPITDGVVITAPSFDHALKDPTPDTVAIYPYHRIVIIEGLYTCLDVGEWADAARLLDERVYLRLDVAEAKRRLVKRHVITGVAQDVEAAHFRADNSDMPNGLFVIENMLEPTQIIDSVDDPVLAS